MSRKSETRRRAFAGFRRVARALFPAWHVLFATSMRLPAVALTLLAPLAAPIVAHARPVTVGIGAGRIDAENDWDGEADKTLQIFGRLGLTGRVGGQLELQKLEGSTNTVARTGTALIVVEMGQSGRLVPTMFAGLGLDHATDSYGGSQNGSHIEGGFGLEYRFDGGLSLMGDVRLGGRSVEQDNTVILDGGYAALYAPMLIEGEYKSIRVGLAIRL
jgi:hypothetical protein